MPPLFDQYKLMDRGATKKFADAGGKDTIKNILIAAANKQDSQIATALLIRDLLNFKVAQATDKKNTTDPERWLKILPTHIEAVNKLLPQNDVNSLLTEINLRQFIANSSSIFQRQIPGTFKAVLDEVIRLPGVKSRLVDSYTAKFLKSNSVAGITDNDVRNAHNVETRKRPTALEIKKFFEQLCLLPEENLPIGYFTFKEMYKPMMTLLDKFFDACVLDWNRMIGAEFRNNQGVGNTIDQTWNIHVFKVLDFVNKVEKPSPLANLKKAIGYHELLGKLSIAGYHGQLPTTKIFDRFNGKSKLQNITNFTKSANWLVFCSGHQGVFGVPNVWAVNLFYFIGYAIDKNLENIIERFENIKVVCALPGGWTDMQYMQIYCRRFHPLSYDITKQSFKLYTAYELYWVPNGIKNRNCVGAAISDVGDDANASFPSQGSWWVTLTLDISFQTTINEVKVRISDQVNPIWEVFDSKPTFLRTKWPNSSS